MYDLASTNVDAYVVGVQDQIASFRFAVRYALANLGLTPGRSRQGDTELRVYALCEPGTVSAFCQTCAPIFIRITYELKPVRSNCCFR